MRLRTTAALVAAGGLIVALASVGALALWRTAADADLRQCVGYYSGKGMPQDFPRAAVWCRKAVERGGFAEAESDLGAMYLKGEGVPQSYSEAVDWFRKAVAQGDAVAESNLGTVYENGWGVPQDYNAANAWFQKSVAQGAALGELNLAINYDQGRGVPRDLSTAAIWYRKAADQGEPQAQYNLGVMYLNGDGVAQNQEEAANWFRKGAAQGDADSQKALNEVLASADQHSDTEADSVSPAGLDDGAGAQSPEEPGTATIYTIFYFLKLHPEFGWIGMGRTTFDSKEACLTTVERYEWEDRISAQNRPRTRYYRCLQETVPAWH